MSFQLSAVIPQQNPLACSYPRPYAVIPSGLLCAEAWYKAPKQMIALGARGQTSKRL